MSKVATKEKNSSQKPKPSKTRKSANIDKIRAGIETHYAKMEDLKTKKQAWLVVIHLWDNRFRVNMWDIVPGTEDNFISSYTITHSWFVHATKKRGKDGAIVVSHEIGGKVTEAKKRE